MQRLFVLVLGLGVATATLAVPLGQTKITDQVPVFDLEYFVGTWTFDWAMPDTPLGPGGDVTGTQTYTLLMPPVKFGRLAGFPLIPAKAVPDGFLNDPAVEARVEATGPEGPLKARVVIGFNRKTQDAIRYEIPARGTATMRTGRIGGDLGGTYTFFWESTPIRSKGQTIKMQGRTTIYSPSSFRELIQYSVDGGPFKTFGQPWYEKRP